jgi:putative transposase
MPRAPRPQGAGLIYHVTSRGNRRSAIYRDDHDRQRFLGILEHVVSTFGWVCHAYCAMTTHFHIQVTTLEATIAAGMQQLNGLYGQTFNRRHAERGHVFQGRYHSELIEREAHFVETARYIALNPVRAGLCRRPEEWPWSSYGATVGLKIPAKFLNPDALVGYFAHDRESGRRRFAEYVEAGGRADLAASANPRVTLKGV